MEVSVRRVMAIAVLWMCGSALAADHRPARTPAMPTAAAAAAKDANGAEVHLPYTHPQLPAAARWPGVTTLVILGSFVIAAGVGVVVRLNAPEELPPTHSHDEPPGASHHHGPGGTVQPGPEHDLPGGHAHHPH
jgi:hypothetical protein